MSHVFQCAALVLGVICSQALDQTHSPDRVGYAVAEAKCPLIISVEWLNTGNGCKHFAYAKNETAHSILMVYRVSSANTKESTASVTVEPGRTATIASHYTFTPSITVVSWRKLKD